MRFRGLGVSSLVAVGALALVLSGCGGSGGPESGGMPGNGSGLSLQEKWQRFTGGNPALGLTAEQALDELTAVLDVTTHSVEFGASIDGPAVVAVPDRFELPADAEVTAAPVMEHNGIPVAEIGTRQTFGLPDAEETYLADTLSYDGWLDDTHFGVAVSRLCPVARADCSGTDPEYEFASVSGAMYGRYSGTNPTGMGSATWTGVMVGMEAPEYVTAEAAALLHEQPDVFLGDARIAIDDLAAPDVDISFTGIRNVTQGTSRDDMTWENLRVVDGLFGSWSGEEDQLLGMFNGLRHQEVGGEFARDGIAGAFGAKRR